MLNEQAFEEWIEYKRSMGKKYKNIDRQKAKFEKWPFDVQARAVEKSIDEEWAGLFFEKCLEKPVEVEGDFIARHTNRDWTKGLIN